MLISVESIDIAMKPPLLCACTVMIITLANMAAYAAPGRPAFESNTKSEFAFKIVYRNNASWIEQAKRSVKTKMRNNGDFEFRNVFVNQNKVGNRFACGEVRIKDARGRHGKYKRFISAARTDVTFIEGTVKHFKSGWDAYCSSEGRSSR